MSQLLVELYDLLEREPRSVDIREIILEQWIQIGDRGAALGVAREILKINPKHAKAKKYIDSQAMPQSSLQAAGSSRPREEGRQQRQGQPQQQQQQRQQQQQQQQQAPVATNPKSRRITPGREPASEADRAKMETAFEKDYRRLMGKAAGLNEEMLALRAVQKIKDGEDMIENIHAIMTGHMSTVVSRRPPRAIRELARDLQANPEKCLGLIIEDFLEVVQWEFAENPSLDSEAIRRRLRQRQQILQAAVPEAMQALARDALMHLEHELNPPFGKKYANTETMLGDAVKKVPRAKFLATEDNYAWDMSELANALEANGGVMRNPLSRELFSADDARAILAHPLGQRLRPRVEEQANMKNGVRAETVAHIARLATVMLADQSADALPSLQAIDEFLTFEATLPAAERRVLDVLKIPATDRHTRLAYDFTISEAISDAKANRTCFHKTGDFLSQAASFLRKVPTVPTPVVAATA